MGGFADRCPSADGIVEGTFEYLLSVAEDRNVGGEVRRTVDFRHFNGRLRGEVGDNAELKDIEVRGTYTATRDMPGEAASGTSREVGPLKFAPNRGGAPDWEAMKQLVLASGDVAVGNVILMGGWIYSLAELEWRKPNACVELAFEPRTDTRALGANAPADVKIGLRTKTSESAFAGFRSEGMRVLREGSVSPANVEAKQGAQASVTYTASAKPKRGDGISLAAVSKAGIAEGSWRIIERARYEGSFTQTDQGAMTVQGGHFGAATNCTVKGRLVWMPDDEPKAKPAFGDANPAFYKVTDGEITVVAKGEGRGPGGVCRYEMNKTFPVAQIPPAGLRYMTREVAQDGRYRISLGMQSFYLMGEVEARCEIQGGIHTSRSPLNDAAVMIGVQNGRLDDKEGVVGRLAAPIRLGPRSVEAEWSFMRKVD